nr:DUF1801 domain-containing protein [Microbacterium bovistercoris]
MAEKTADKTAEKTGKSGFSADERAAMKQRAAELRAEKQAAKGAEKREQGLRSLQEAIAALEGVDRELAEKLHEIVTEVAPQLEPKTWYGFPSYAKDGSVLCFFQPASKFKTRYATLGFNDVAQLDDGPMWPTVYALIEFTPEVEERVRALVAKAAG